MLDIINLTYSYDQAPVIEDITLHINKHETVAILGTSGVGKTTLFNLIASNLDIQSGSITIDGTSEIKGKISYMLQKDMLFQHKSVIENITLPLIIQGVSKKQAQDQAQELLEAFNLAQWADYYPSALSGGMRQRIAFLRTACFHRDYLLLDEAFSALDAITRRQMHQWFFQNKERLNWSTLLITHDVEEALILSERIYVLNGKPGKIILEMPVDIVKDNFHDLIFQEDFLKKKRTLLEALSQ